MALLIAAFSMYDCMSDMENWQYNQLQTAQTRLTLAPETSNDQAKIIANQVDGELVMTSAIEIEPTALKRPPRQPSQTAPAATLSPTPAASKLPPTTI